jgi:hypothetical protein
MFLPQPPRNPPPTDANGNPIYSTPNIPTPSQPPQIQYPQLSQQQLPSFLPNPVGYPGFGQGMPYIRNRTLGNVLSPLMQPNYGVPIVNPYGGGQQQPQLPVMGGGFGQMMNSGQMPNFPGGQWGLQPIRGLTG